jgi:shikimate dehydrogenase
MKAGVIGFPISHSLSPFIFKFIARNQHIEIDYDAFEVLPQNALSFIQDLNQSKKCIGLNVTIPFKENFLNELDYTSPEVRAIGALNVLHWSENKLFGFNTDIVGIQKTFEDQNFDVQNTNCLVLGAGGSAKALAFVLGINKARNVIIINRSNRVHSLIETFSKLFPETSWKAVNDFSELEKIKDPFDLVVNTTPLGMTGKESGKDFFSNLNKLNYSLKALAFDFIYTPESSEFMQIAKLLGLKTVGGLGMLIDQALATWKIWIGKIEDEKNFHLQLKHFLSGLLRIRQETKPIFLTGFMGVGKSSVGQLMAQFLGKNFIDTDQLIETKAGLSIKEIFKTKGEDYFRKIENEVLGDLQHAGVTNNCIVSLGGGSLIKEENFKSISTSGFLVYLKASEETIFERVKNQIHLRPMLMNLSEIEVKQKIVELLSKRTIVYDKAESVVQTDNLSLEDCVYKIISVIGQL